MINSDSALVRVRPDSPTPIQKRRPGPGVLGRSRKDPEAIKSDAVVNYGKYRNPVQRTTKKRTKSRTDNSDLNSESSTGLVQVVPFPASQKLDEAFDIFQYLNNLELSGSHLVRSEQRYEPGDIGENYFDVALSEDRAKVTEIVNFAISTMHLTGVIEVTNLTRMNLAYKFLCSDKLIQTRNELIGWVLPLKTIELRVSVPPESCLSIMNSRIGLAVHPVYSPTCLSPEGLQRVWEMISTNTFGIVAEIHEIKMIMQGTNIGPISWVDYFLGRSKILEVPVKKMDSSQTDNNLNLYATDDTGIKVEEYIILREQHRNFARGIKPVDKTKRSKCWWIIPFIILALLLVWYTDTLALGFEDDKLGKGANKPCENRWKGCK